jgi:hypothetical protein
MERIHKIDRDLNKVFKSFANTATSIPFSLIGDLSDAELVAEQTYAGIYLIEVKTTQAERRNLDQWLTQFSAQWLAPEYYQKFVANPQKKRIEHHAGLGTLQEWMPVYIGKSKKVHVRLWEHVHLPLDKRTFSMKLASRPTMMSRKWRFSTISLDGVKNYDVLAPKMELAMRNKLHPIVGR